MNRQRFINMLMDSDNYTWSDIISEFPQGEGDALAMVCEYIKEVDLTASEYLYEAEANGLLSKGTYWYNRLAALQVKEEG